MAIVVPHLSFCVGGQVRAPVSAVLDAGRHRLDLFLVL
jgi:hypothetical protein